MTIPKTGRIVAWTIALGNPGAQQTTFFNQRLGGESEAQLTILNPRSRLRSRAVAQGEPAEAPALLRLDAAVRAREVHPRATRAGSSGSRCRRGRRRWRSASARTRRGARAAAAASATTPPLQTAQLAANQLAQYFCLYRTARLTYTATLIPDPVKPPAQ